MLNSNVLSLVWKCAMWLLQNSLSLKSEFLKTCFESYTYIFFHCSICYSNGDCKSFCTILAICDIICLTKAIR